MEMLSGAEMVIRSLQDQKVEYIYGYPGVFCVTYL